MIILPAIDLLGGQCVRLVKGEYDTAHKVAEDPVLTARHFVDSGAEYIHLVDLDGAKNGHRHPLNDDAIRRIIQAVNVPVELGGGLRTMDDLARAEDCGVSRLILGSAATDTDFLSAAVARFGDKIAVGIDAKDGFVALAGWREKTTLPYLDFARHVESLGVSTIIFTDIDRDGTLSGPNTRMLAELKQAVGCRIIASGGIKSRDDIASLLSLELYGAICGKSLYAGTLDLREAVAMTRA